MGMDKSLESFDFEGFYRDAACLDAEVLDFLWCRFLRHFGLSEVEDDSTGSQGTANGT